MSGFKGTCKWRGKFWGPGDLQLYKRNRKSSSTQAIALAEVSDTQGWRLSQCYSSADQDMFCVNWFSIKLQNVIINWIHFTTCGGGPLVSGGCYQMYFFFTGQWTYNWEQGLWAAVCPIILKQPKKTNKQTNKQTKKIHISTEL